jgi:hypothetical protein
LSKKQKIKIQLEELILTVRKKLKPKTEADPIRFSGQTYAHPGEEMAEVARFNFINASVSFMNSIS